MHGTSHASGGRQPVQKAAHAELELEHSARQCEQINSDELRRTIALGSQDYVRDPQFCAFSDRSIEGRTQCHRILLKDGDSLLSLDMPFIEVCKLGVTMGKPLTQLSKRPANGGKSSDAGTSTPRMHGRTRKVENPKPKMGYH